MPDSFASPEFDFIAPGRVPLIWCLLAFIATFLVTRLIVRYIRATVGDSGPGERWVGREWSLRG